MRFRIASRPYSVRITEGPIVSDGAEYLGFALQSSQEILIAADCPVRDRMRVLYGQLFRAWALESGHPRDDAGWYELGASMANAASTDLNMQGGETALLGLRPGESPEPAAARIPNNMNRVCGVCQSTVAAGSILCRPSDLPGLVELKMYCEFCGKTQVWREAQTAKGMPCGQIIGAVLYEPGDTTGMMVGV